MSDDEINLAELSDEELVLQMHDDLYDGLKEEIEELGDTELGQKLNEKILSIVVDTVSYNPSETLESKNHGDKGPILEVLNSVAEMVKDLKK